MYKNNASALLKGLKFGMVLQFAVGPVCLLVFNISVSYGFFSSLHAVSAITVVDALYITLSGAGAAALLGRPSVRNIVRFAGSAVLILFGANTVSGAFDLSLLPQTALFSDISGTNIFMQGFLLTASNPLTIIFWSGMFSVQITENRWNKRELFMFAAGCVTATILFLTFTAAAGSIMGVFLPEVMLDILNLGVGIILIIFGFKLIYKKERT